MYFINYICLGELKYSQHLCMLSTCAKNVIVLYGECSFNLHVQCVFFNKKGKKVPKICTCFHSPFKILAKQIFTVIITDFTINIQDVFHSFESFPRGILAPIWTLFILQNISSWVFFPFGGSGVFLRPSHSSEYDREEETPLTMAVHWVVLPQDKIGRSPLIKSHYLLLEHICESCFKRPTHR